MFRKAFKLIYTIGHDTARAVTGIERNFSLIKRNVETLEKSKLDPEDTFGTLAPHAASYLEKERDDEPEGDYFGKRDTIKKMKICLDAHEYDNALQLLKDMQKRERAPLFAYNLLISYNAKIGNATEAFRLYNDFKKRAYYVTGRMYTSLFTACGNCQRPDIALQIAYKVSNQLLEKEKFPNLLIYHAMFKAFGRHGDLSMTFQLMDRLKEKKVKITSETYSRLLESCLSDKGAGLRFALLIWHYMLKENIKPNIFIFKTMAKCAQDCSLGDVELVMNFLNEIVRNDKRDRKNQLNVNVNNMLGSGEETVLKPVESAPNGGNMEDEYSNSLFLVPNKLLVTNQVEQTELSITCDSTDEENSLLVRDSQKGMKLPNVLHPNPTWGSVVDLGDMSSPVNRFMLFGGLEGFLKVMDHFNIKPDTALFSILVFCIPNTKEAEEELMRYMEKYNVKKDIRLVNALLKKRVHRGDTFQDCLDYLSNIKMKHNFITMRILAIVCSTNEDFKKWAELMRRYRIRITERHVFPLLKNASHSHDMNYVSDVLAMAKEEEVELGSMSLDLLKTTLIEASSEKADK